MKLENKILFFTGLGHFFNHVGNYLTPALLIYLQTDIPLTQTERGLLGSIPMLLMVILSTGVGWIGDRHPYSRKHLIWVGTIGLGVFSILMSSASSFSDLALATVILGISVSTYHPVAFTFLTGMKNQDKNMGTNAVFGNAGSATTPLLAMLFSIIWNWRIAFLLFAGMQIIAGIIIWIFFPNTKEVHDDLINGNLVEKEKEENTINHVFILMLLLILISAFRAPVFRCISYFTTIVFSDAFLLGKEESSILTAVVLGLGALSTYIMGSVNNRRISKGIPQKQRIGFRIDTILISSGVSTVLLLILALLPSNLTIVVLIAYLFLTIFFFLGASVLPTIMSEVAPKDIGSAFGILFAGSTLTGAIAPTVFGLLADNYDFNASFWFLGIVALGCLIFIFMFKYHYNREN
ncbi:MAG: MFS transporter [Candidatus Heimdallarchaeota archaeon]|nr:MFS transporter [Candidatus Heimdallarchaeota archaeon]